MGALRPYPCMSAPRAPFNLAYRSIRLKPLSIITQAAATHAEGIAREDDVKESAICEFS